MDDDNDHDDDDNDDDDDENDSLSGAFQAYHRRRISFPQVVKQTFMVDCFMAANESRDI